MKKNNRLLPDWKDSGGLQQVSRMMKCVLFFMLTPNIGGYHHACMIQV